MGKHSLWSVPPNHFWPPLPLMPNWLGEWLIGRWAKKRPYRYRLVKVIIVAPEHFSLATRIIDFYYEESRQLIEDGYEAAKKAFEDEFRG